MIKFIATDLDGTLLNEKKELPKDFDEVLNALNEKGIQFAISSGRQYDTILKQFEKYGDQITIIAENGAIVYEKGKRIILDPLDNDSAAEILAAVKNEPGLYSLACGANGAMGEEENEEHIKNVIMYYVNYRTVDNVIEASRHDDILKIAIYDDELSENHCYKVLKKFHNTHNVLVSGEHWLDVMKTGVTKGSAIEHIQKLRGYKPEECMAFGDFMNDADMMRVCFHSYAMENAHPDLKALCRFSAPSNDDSGVTKIIKKAVLNKI